MPPRPRRSMARRMGNSRRRLVWCQSRFTFNVAANNNWGSIDLLSAYRTTPGVVTQGLTVLRSHLWFLPLAPAAGDLFWLGLDVRDTNDTGVAPGALAQISNPRDEPFKDWMFAKQFQYDTSLFLPQWHTTGQAVVLDLKARRRIRNVNDTFAVTLLQELVATPVKTYNGFARTLLALP